jgi:hypothetical protein
MIVQLIFSQNDFRMRIRAGSWTLGRVLSLVSHERQWRRRESNKPRLCVKKPISERRGTESGTVDAPKTPSDPDLAFILDRWPSLPEHVKAAVMALIRTAQKGGNGG